MKMSKKKRLHPISVVANIVKQLKDAILPIILVIIVGNKTISSMWDIAVPFAIIIYTIVIGIVSWIRFTYRLEEGELRIEYGVFVRKKRYIPFERIQGISISQGFLQRMFGVVKVNVETAGNQLGEAEGLSKKSIKTERMEKTMSFSIRSVSLFLKLVWEFAAHFSMLWAIATIPNSVRTL
jgi:putative membrane protein